MDISCKEAIKLDDICENPSRDTRTVAEDVECDQVDSQHTSSVQTLTTKLQGFSTTTTTSSSGQVPICSTREVGLKQEQASESSAASTSEERTGGMIPIDQMNMGGSDDQEEPYSLIEFADEKKILLSKMGQEFLFEYGGHDVGQDTTHDDLEEAVLLEGEDSDSSDLLDSDSEDEDDDVVSIPLRGRCIQYLRHAICQDPCFHCLKTSGPAAKSGGKCKTIDAYSMDFKLKVLEWAYSKSIHSAGHHFNLERCVVRNWMMNEEKIFLLASSKGRRKWARYDSGKKGSTTRYSKANLDLRLVSGLLGLRVSGNGNGGSRS